MFASMIVIKLQLLYWLIFVMTDIPFLLLAPLAFSAVYSLSYISIPRNDLAKRDKWIVFCAFPFTVLWMVLFFHLCEFGDTLLIKKLAGGREIK